MALEERARQELLDRLEHVLGPRHAQTLMAFLPPLAGSLEQRFDTVLQRIETGEQRVLAAVRGELNTLVATQTRVLVLGLLGAFTAQTGVVLAPTRMA